METKPKVIVITGPTATGKSHCGIRLAQELDGEIISGDSMCVFRRMNVATAKPTPEELALVPHHLIDILEPNEKYSVVDFQQQADALIRDCQARGKMPIIVGGTGLYIKALLEKYEFSSVDESAKLRRELEEFAEHNGNAALYQRLKELDPQAAAQLKINDRRRIIRSVETILGGDRVSVERAPESPYEAAVYGLIMPREILYQRINRRVDIMVEQGLFEETKALLEEGVEGDAQSMKSIGYRQVLRYFDGEWSRQECIDKIKQATRNFAKRQITWYKKMPYIHWFELTEPPCYEACIKEMMEDLHQKNFY
ncbi:tRNA (adenosine(37)-N6)-dimethylallyltransferase MiaA [Acidaminococcus sp. AM05-11]|uniref:tRNA (adenosine(37)-N6)-dimethylallyltransferase MiaA n=1 Tax=Acidaminococcus sp. AM05-11 TaxID=2291997 RepID=UPI000E4EEB71|nr:tRNA (adenosine(37)-N6)-dimethylallyltransferase MiaA [Acidaminococcus sp. AM05-11]RHK03397.1 tRNA (adenosine(37)-N6)-dimethylallyltransferase MiaA [Acidaminococcus sp. AM05-11]